MEGSCEYTDKQTANNSISGVAQIPNKSPAQNTKILGKLYWAPDLDRSYPEDLNINVSTTFKIGVKIFHICCHMTGFDCVSLETKLNTGWQTTVAC
jgi:hypothetical protein